MLGLIPMQVVAVVLWGANPAFASGLRQPVKGVVLACSGWCCIISPAGLHDRG